MFPLGNYQQGFWRAFFPSNFRKENHPLRASFLIGKTDSERVKGAFDGPGRAREPSS